MGGEKVEPVLLFAPRKPKMEGKNGQFSDILEFQEYPWIFGKSAQKKAKTVKL